MVTILVIDDERQVRDVVRDILRDEGYRVIAAAHGLDGLGVLKTVMVDCILCDLMMPVMAGDAFAAALHADPRYRHIPVLIMSAAPNALPLAPGTYAGIIEKPWTILKLLATITAALGAATPALPGDDRPAMSGMAGPDGPIIAA
ncbi:MAG TPA: response regulator [Herpetosiphonaceae bacterium]|nr:response regulator [Herpetosiphonaceae bacterium]